MMGVPSTYMRPNLEVRPPALYLRESAQTQPGPYFFSAARKAWAVSRWYSSP